MKRFVNAVEWVAVVCAVIFVVLLFANEPASTGGASGGGTLDGAEVFASHCAGCHGADGGGGIGPQLSDGKVASALTRDVEIGVVTNGFGGMPAWKDRLSKEEIEAVVDYTRTL